MTPVKVVDGYAVFHDGRHHVGGEVVEVPPDIAEKWTQRGYVVPTEPPRRRRTTK